MSKIKRAAFHYFGSKWRMAKMIIDLIPQHKTFVEVFGGSAAVLLQKPPSRVDVYNDLCGDVVNFFRVLRDNGDELISRIWLTPYSRQEFELACKPGQFNDVERARRFYVRAQMSRCGNMQHVSGWKYEIKGLSGSKYLNKFNKLDNLMQIATRLKLVQIESGDAFDVIERYDTKETVFYVDPPYPGSVRASETRYINDMPEDEKHARLSDALHSVNGGVILSNYKCALYDDLYHDFTSVNAGNTDTNGQAVNEVLWLSQRLINMRMPLFNQGD